MLLILVTSLSLEPVQKMFIHQPHVGIMFNALQLVITVEILSGAVPDTDNTAWLTTEARGLLVHVEYWILKMKIFLCCHVISSRCCSHCGAIIENHGVLLLGMTGQ